MAVIGNLVAKLNMDSRGFTRGAQRAQGTLSRLGDGLKKTARFAAGAAAALAAIGAGAAIAGVKKQAAALDDLAKKADRLGLTTQNLAGLRHAAELSGVAANTLDMALQRMTRRISEAASGSGEAVGALNELGLSAQRLESMSPDAAFRRIADAFGAIDNQADKVRLAMKLFDSEGVALVNTLEMTSEGLLRAQEEAEKLGIAVNRQDAAKIETMNDAVTRMSSAWTGMINKLSVYLAPLIEELAADMTAFLASTNKQAKDASGSVSDLAKSFRVVYDAIWAVKVAWTALNGAVTTLLLIATKPLELFEKSWNNIEAAIRGSEAGLNTFMETWRDQLKDLALEQEKTFNNLLNGPPPSKQIEAARKREQLAKRLGQGAGMPNRAAFMMGGNGNQVEKFDNAQTHMKVLNFLGDKLAPLLDLPEMFKKQDQEFSSTYTGDTSAKRAGSQAFFSAITQAQRDKQNEVAKNTKQTAEFTEAVVNGVQHLVDLFNENPPLQVADTGESG